jgi:hypothetical protein
MALAHSLEGQFGSIGPSQNTLTYEVRFRCRKSRNSDFHDHCEGTLWKVVSLKPRWSSEEEHVEDSIQDTQAQPICILVGVLDTGYMLALFHHI